MKMMKRVKRRKKVKVSEVVKNERKKKVRFMKC